MLKDFFGEMQKRDFRKTHLGTSSEKKTGLSGNISHTRGEGLTQTHLFMFVYQVFFACQNHPEVLKNIFYYFEIFCFGTSSEKNGILSKKFPYWGGGGRGSAHVGIFPT